MAMYIDGVTTGLTMEEVIADLEYGRSSWAGPDDRLQTIQSLPRPTLGGPRFLGSYLAARLLGSIHPRLARPWLLRLWFTPWVHPSARVPVTDLPAGLAPWSHAVGEIELGGYQGGAGETAVLLHGWSGRAADMRHLAGDLVAAGWRVVAPDLPAHGSTPGRRTDLFEMGDAVTSVLDHERPAIVVTHSMGFPALMLALESGASAPDRAVAIAPGRKMSHAMDRFVRQARLGDRLADELRLGLEDRFGGRVWDLLDVDRVLGDLDFDGLVVHDRDDDEVPMEDARHIADVWRDATLVETAHLGHRRILRDDAVRSCVTAWLAADPERAANADVPCHARAA